MAELNTYGRSPGKTDWKLFEIDGWTLLIELGPNENGDGLGIHYRTTVAELEGMSVSIWFGNANENERTEALFEKTFREIDDDGARRGLQVLLDNALPLMGDA